MLKNEPIAVEGATKAKTLAQCHRLAGSDQLNGEVPSELLEVAALFVSNAFTPLTVWKCGMATFKNAFKDRQN